MGRGLSANSIEIITKSKEIIDSYTSKITLRQLFYRLVSMLVLDNSEQKYHELSRLLVRARKEGLIPFEALEDRTRKVSAWINGYHTFWKKEVQNKLEEVERPPYIAFGSNVMQEEITLIVVEKQALEGIFRSAIRTMSVLVVCRGYNSLTQIKELADLLEQHPEKKIYCYFFSDFDPSGFDIERNFLEQSQELGIKFESFERIGINKDQIDDFNIPYAPVKTSDSRSDKFIREHGTAGVVELDALDPNVLRDLIQECCSKHYNKELRKRLNKVERIQQRRAKKLYAKRLKELAEELSKEDEE